MHGNVGQCNCVLHGISWLGSKGCDTKVWKCTAVQRFKMWDTVNLCAFSPQLIANCQQQLLPGNANIVILSKRYEVEGICKLREKWFQTPYAAEGMCVYGSAKTSNMSDKYFVDCRQSFHFLLLSVLFLLHVKLYWTLSSCRYACPLD